MAILPRNTGVQALQAGETHFLLGEYTAAEQAYAEALDLLPHDPQPALRLAELYHTWGLPEKGIAALEETNRRGGTSPVQLELNLLAEAKAWSQLEEKAYEHLEEAPGEVQVLAILTDALLQQGKCAEAVKVAAMWREAAPQDPNALRTWGILNLQEGTAASILALCQSDVALCQALQSNNHAPLQQDLSIGQTLLHQNAAALAACVLQHAVDTDATSADAHAWLGSTLDAIGQPQEAYPHLQKATELAPQKSLGWLLLGTHYLNQNQLEHSREALLKAYQLDPANPAPCLALAAVAAAQGNYTEAPDWIAAALKYATDDPEVWKAAARFYLERNLQQDQEPLASAKIAVKLAPEDAETWMLLGWARLMAGEIQPAIDTLDVALGLKANSTITAQTYYLRGLALKAAGDEQEAEQAFIRAADLGYQR